MSNSDSPIPQPSGAERPAPEKRPRKSWNVKLGQVVVTSNAADQLPNSALLIGLARHACGDWGDVCEDDWQLNNEAMEFNNRLHSVYHTAQGVVFWIITEWDRSITTILLPDDY